MPEAVHRSIPGSRSVQLRAFLLSRTDAGAKGFRAQARGTVLAGRAVPARCGGGLWRSGTYPVEFGWCMVPDWPASAPVVGCSTCSAVVCRSAVTRPTTLPPRPARTLEVGGIRRGGDSAQLVLSDVRPVPAPGRLVVHREAPRLSYGYSICRCQPPSSARVNNVRSCRRPKRASQNSIRAGSRRYPPQNTGRGMSCPRCRAFSVR